MQIAGLPQITGSHNQHESMLDSSDSDININRKVSISKYRKKQAANDAQLLM